jgi:uncharacterized membrane protein
MNQATLKIILVATPIVIGGLIAAINAKGVNDTTEKVEAWTRKRQQGASVSSGWFSNYIINPILWIIVKFCDWTDGFTHDGLKNGIRVAATLYLIAAWLFILYVAFMIAVMIVITIAILYVVFKVLAGSNDNEPERRDTNEPRRNMQSGRSEKKEKLFGGEYTQYYDESGNEVATAEVKEKLFGGKFVQYFDKNGDEIGTGELKEKFFGGKYVQQYDEDNNEIGTSETKEKFFGGKYTQHYDKDGNESGTSEKKEKFFGGEYTEHKPKDG